MAVRLSRRVFLVSARLQLLNFPDILGTAKNIMGCDSGAVFCST